MVDRLVVIPSTVFSPRSVEAVPATRALLDWLRTEFDVEVYRWPYMRDADGVPSWQGETTGMRALFGERCHVLCFGGTAGLAMVAVGSSESVETFISDGLFPPPATLRRLGDRSAAEAAEVTIRSGRTGLSQYVRFLTLDDGGSQAAGFITLLDDEIDWAKEQQHAQSYVGLDLLREARPITVPALSLQLPLPIAGYDEDGSILRRFVPGVTLEPLEPWHFNDTAAGARLAERVIGFIREVQDSPQPDSAK